MSPRSATASAEFEKATVVSREVRLKAQNQIVRIIKLDEIEGMLSTHLAELLNISESGLRQHISNHAIGAQPVLAHRMRSELGADVIPMFARSVLFIPKASIKQLVKVVNTDEAWAIYFELWEYAERFAALEIERGQLLAERDQLRAERDELFLQRGDALATAEALTMRIDELTQVERAQTKAESARGTQRIRKYRVEESEFVATSVLHGPKRRTTTKRLRLDQMTHEQRETHALQKGTLSACGFIKSAGDRMTLMNVQNPILLSKREVWQRAGEDFLNELIPPPLEFDGTFH